MKLHILSDIHLETRRTTWRSFVDRIPADLGDVLVLAGDIVCLADVDAPEMLGRLRGKARQVVYVLGNHEHYHGTFDETKAAAARLCAAADIHLLDGKAVELGGRRILGASLWFRRDEEARPYRQMMSDFQLIEGFEDAVYRDNERDLGFFASETRPGDVVVSHHLPSWSSVAAEYREGPRAPLNAFFVCDCEEVMRKHRPALWIHGHTHTPADYRVGETRVLCNPIGYPREGENGRLDLVVKV